MYEELTKNIILNIIHAMIQSKEFLIELIFPVIKVTYCPVRGN